MDHDALRKRYSKHSDDKLLRIISIERHEYEKAAVKIAKETLRQRGLNFLFEPSTADFTKNEIARLKKEFEAQLTGNEDLAKVFEQFIKKGFNPLQLYIAFDDDSLPESKTSDINDNDQKILQKELEHKKKVHNMEIAVVLGFPALCVFFLCRTGNPLGILVTFIISIIMIWVYNSTSAKDKIARLEKDLSERKKLEVEGIVLRVEKIRNAGGGRLESALRPGFVGKEDEYFYRMLIETEEKDYELDCTLEAYRSVREGQRCTVGISCHSHTVLSMDNHAAMQSGTR